MKRGHLPTFEYAANGKSNIRNFQKLSSLSKHHSKIPESSTNYLSADCTGVLLVFNIKDY